jgi:hypothetical protein
LEITAIAIDPSNSSRIYVVTKVGVFRSDDAGNSWTRVYDATLSVKDTMNLVFPRTVANCMNVERGKELDYRIIGKELVISVKED